jgi:GNAT superfamily N-acetyltransferase
LNRAAELIVRRLDTEDLALLKRLRLEALASDPDEFGSTYEREAGRSDTDWQRWFTNGVVFVAEQPLDGAVGLVAGSDRFLDDGIAYMVSMWVRPSHRGSGAADALVKAVLAWAESVAASAVKLHVVGGNVRATRLYTRHGFYPTGNVTERERDGAIEIEMQRD